jgi:hypothetical protein
MQVRSHYKRYCAVQDCYVMTEDSNNCTAVCRINSVLYTTLFSVNMQHFDVQVVALTVRRDLP